MTRWGLAMIGCFAAGFALAQTPPAQPAAKPNCKIYGSGTKCCDPAIAAHLAKADVISACGQSEATYLGEKAEKDTCTYYFKVGSEKEDSTFVQVFAPKQPNVPPAPNDPFFSYKKMGKVFVLDKAKSPKAQSMIQNSMGLWMPGKDYFVSVKASTKVCAKTAAKKLAAAMK